MDSSGILPSSSPPAFENFTTRSTETADASYNVWYTAFFVVLSLNFIGNLLVIIVIVTDRRFHSTMNFLFTNMAISDFLSGVFALLWYVVNNITPQWKSEWICRIVAANSITVLSGLVSIFTLTAITLERYNAIVKPLEHRMSWLRFKLILVFIWTSAIVCSLPYFIFIDITDEKGNKRCENVLPPGRWRQLLTTLTFVFMYVCPNTVICVAYIKLVKHLWYTKENESMKESNQALIRSRKKITKLLGSVLVMFNICTFPNSVADFMLSFGAVGFDHKFLHVVFIMQLFSTCVNPFIFFIQSKQFRNQLINLFCCRTRKINRWATLRGTGLSSRFYQTPSLLHHNQATV